MSLADSEYDKIAKELAELEVEVANTVAAQQTAPDSMQGMTAALAKVMNEMKASPNISPDIIAQAEAHMTALMHGINQVSIQARQVSAASLPAQLTPQVPPLPEVVSSTEAAASGGPTARRTTVAQQSRASATPYGLGNTAEVFHEPAEIAAAT